MIVERMSFQKMRSQALRDYNAINQIANKRVPVILKVMRRTNMTKFFKYYDHVMESSHNRWLYSISSNGNIKNTFIGNLCYFYVNDEYAALSVNSDRETVCYYSPHFFERYCERRINKKMGIKEVMMTFYKESNERVILPTSKPENGKMEVSVQTKYGVCFGTMHIDLKFLELRTFINNDMLKGEQIEMSYALEKKFNLEVERPKEKSLKERPYLYNIIFPLPDYLTGLLQKGATRRNTALLKFL
jgi:hypothetical protein